MTDTGPGFTAEINRATHQVEACVCGSWHILDTQAWGIELPGELYEATGAQLEGAGAHSLSGSAGAAPLPKGPGHGLALPHLCPRGSLLSLSASSVHLHGEGEEDTDS